MTSSGYRTLYFLAVYLLLSIFFTKTIYSTSFLWNTTWNSGTAENWTTSIGTATYDGLNYQSNGAYSTVIWQNYSVPNTVDLTITGKVYHNQTNPRYCWIKLDNTTTDDWGSSDINLAVEFDDQTTDVVIWSDGGSVTCDYDFNSVNSFLIKLNSSDNDGIEVYMDGSLICTDTFASGLFGESDILAVRAYYGTGSDYQCYWDDVAIQWTEGAVSPSITVNSNLVNTKNINELSDVFTFNGTLSDTTSNYYNCSLLNFTNVLNTSSVDVTSTNSFNYSWGINFEGTYNLSVNCTNFEASVETIKFSYQIDTLNPVIRSDFKNNTVFNESDDIRIYSNYTDLNLFAYNVSVFNPDGTLYDSNNYFLENITMTFIENLTTLTNVDVGNNYTVRFEVWDSHTNKEVKPIKIDKSDNKVFIDDYLIIEGILDSTFYFKKDKYEFDLLFENKSYEHTIYLKSTKPLIYVGNNNFVWNYERWIDFMDRNVINLTVTKADQGYKLDFSLEKEDNKLKFKSIGDLNFATMDYKFSVQSDVTLSNQLLASIDSNISKIYEVINLIPLVLIYIAFMTIGYWMIRTGNLMLGVMLILQSIGFDFLFIGYYYSVYSPLVTSGVTGSFYWLFIMSMITWIIVKVFGLLTMKVLIRQLE